MICNQKENCHIHFKKMYLQCRLYECMKIIQDRYKPTEIDKFENFYPRVW